MRWKITSFILQVLIVSSLAGCTSQMSNSISTTAPTIAGPYSVVDALDRTVEFSKAPDRIVLAGKGLFMVADAIYLFPEAGSKIVALASTSQGSGNFIPMIDPTFNDKIALESGAGAEQISAAKPDLVILKSNNQKSLGKPVEELGIPVVYVDFENPDQYQRDISILGQVFQNSARATEVAGFFQSKVDSISQTVSSLSDDQKPHTLLLYYSDKDGVIAFNVPPMTWMQTLMIQTAGGKPVWEDANPANGWTTVTLDQIAAWNPDVVFIVSYFVPVNDVVSKLKSDPQWQMLNAVKNNKIYGFATDVYSWDQPDPRWILGMTWLAGKLHPDLFPELDIVKEAQAFYQKLYGIDEASFKKNIEPIMTGDLN